MPANRGHSALIYKFTLTVIGAGRVSTTADVTVEPSTSPPPILDWTENQLPNAFGNALSCGTSSFCLFAGQNGTWVSNDGGSTWTQDYPSWGPITGISCSGVECVEVGGSLPPHRSYSTPDGGQTWNGYVFAGDVGDVSCAPVDLCVVSGLNNSGLPVAWVTTDGGATWTENLLPGGTTSDTYVGVYCASAQNCFISSGGAESRISWRSTDGGTTWKQDQLPQDSIDADVDLETCPTASGCIAIGTDSSSGATWLSKNGGRTWTEKEYPSDSPNSYPVACPATNDCIGLGENGGSSVWISVNEGMTWTQYALPVQLGSTDAEVGGVSCPQVGHCVAEGSDLGEPVDWIGAG